MNIHKKKKGEIFIPNCFPLFLQFREMHEFWRRAKKQDARSKARRVQINLHDRVFVIIVILRFKLRVLLWVPRLFVAFLDYPNLESRK